MQIPKNATLDNKQLVPISLLSYDLLPKLLIPNFRRLLKPQHGICRLKLPIKRTETYYKLESLREENDDFLKVICKF